MVKKITWTLVVWQLGFFPYILGCLVSVTYGPNSQKHRVLEGQKFKVQLLAEYLTQLVIELAGKLSSCLLCRYNAALTFLNLVLVSSCEDLQLQSSIYMYVV